MMKRRYLALLVLPLLAACSDPAYTVDPVVGPDDTRRVDMPDPNDQEALDAQDCFEVSLWEDNGLSGDTEEALGVACMVEEDEAER